MTLLAKGDPDISKLKSGVEHKEYEETKNLGELFREALKGQPVKKTKIKKRVKAEKGYGRNKFRKSGIFGVSEGKKSSYGGARAFRYSYIRENGKSSSMQRKTLVLLYQAMQEKGFEFRVMDKTKARSFINKHCNTKDRNFLMKELCLT